MPLLGPVSSLGHILNMSPGACGCVCICVCLCVSVLCVYVNDTGISVISFPSTFTSTEVGKIG